jgi:signal transduction histidine kinase
MKEIYNKIINFFIHPTLKADKSVYEKSKIAVIAFVVIFFMGIFYELFYLSNNSFWNIKTFHNILGLSVSFIGLFIVKYTGKTNLSLSLGALLGLYLITASSYISGGMNSNDLLWYIVLATTTFMLIGNKEGLLFSILSFAALTFFFIADLNSAIPVVIDPVASSLSYRYFNFALILFVQTFLIYFLVTGNNKLKTLFQQNKEQKVKEEIAADFNHKIGNKLASLRHIVEQAKSKNTQSEQDGLFMKIDSTAKDVYDNFRDFIWILDAKSDKLSELFMYLRDFADDYFKFSDTNIFISSSPDQLSDLVLPSSYSKEIVPLFKEALVNVNKHSEAKNVEMLFIVTETQITIKLKDDGKGFSLPLVKGNGISSIETRAKRIGGKIDISSIPFKGTEIVFTVLLPNKHGILINA